MAETISELFSPDTWFRPGRGPRYRQLSRHIGRAIADGRLLEGDQLPAERDLASIADVSRVTVRKAVADLVEAGRVEQRHGAGSFVRKPPDKLEQSLSSLVSFTENMAARGMTSTSEVLSADIARPTPAEMLALGTTAEACVARIERLRRADGMPIALERSALPAEVVPNPSRIRTSLYAVLRETGQAPVRALQRVTAETARGRASSLLGLPDGAALLRIERTGYLRSGRPVEFTTGLYRPDIYDFVSELRIDDNV